jgi:hypothetical protein
MLHLVFVVHGTQIFWKMELNLWHMVFINRIFVVLNMWCMVFINHIFVVYGFGSVLSLLVMCHTFIYWRVTKPISKFLWCMVLMARHNLWYMNSCDHKFCGKRNSIVVYENHVSQVQAHVPQIWLSVGRRVGMKKSFVCARCVANKLQDNRICGTWLNFCGRWHLNFVAHGTPICGTWDQICGTWFSCTCGIWLW